MAEAYGQLGDLEKAEQSVERVFSENLPPSSWTMALCLLGKAHARQGRLPEAIALFEKSLATDPAPNNYFIDDWAWLGEAARLQGRPTEAEAFLKKALAFKSYDEMSDSECWLDMESKDEAHYLYGNFLLHENRLAEAEIQFQKSLDIRRKGFWGEYGFALLAAKKGDKTAALDWLEKSLDNFYPEPESILAEPLFSKIRKTKRFKAMMLKNFPPGWEER